MTDDAPAEPIPPSEPPPRASPPQFDPSPPPFPPPRPEASGPVLPPTAPQPGLRVPDREAARLTRGGLRALWTIGGIAIAIGTLLPWLAQGFNENAFDVPFFVLLRTDGPDFLLELEIGFPLMAIGGLIALLAQLAGKATARRLLAILVIATAGSYVYRTWEDFGLLDTTEPGRLIDPFGLGPAAVFIGAVLQYIGKDAGRAVQS